jgi:serine/threonine protein kinase/pSer/pThr/pTyr-binding forkhead associated (FHA) protein
MGELPSTGSDFADYRLEALLGRGGMSVVYRAHHIRLSRKVALKFLSPELAEDDSFRERFIREPKAAAAIDHPNIVPIYEAGEHDGLLFIAMRYVEGVDLKSLIEHNGRLDSTQTISIIAQIGNALDAAHARGLVHRDVKPQNVLVVSASGRDSSDHVYLTDFGLTRDTSSSEVLTAAGDFVGTIDYAAPEQIKGKSLDSRTDIYSLGCVAFECLTGLIPFRGENEVAVMYAHLMEAPPSASTARPELSEACDAVLARAMAKTKEDRYPSCRELVEALRSALGDEDGREPRRAASHATVASPAPGGSSVAPERTGQSGDDQEHALMSRETIGADRESYSQLTLPRRKRVVADDSTSALSEKKGPVERTTLAGPWAERMKFARLVYRTSSDQERLCDLTGPSFTVGRDPQADLSLDDPNVSWRHAVFEASGMEWYVSDLGSLNGTVLNGRQLPTKEKGLLVPGAEIKLGETTFIFLSSSLAEGPSPDSDRARKKAPGKGPAAARVTLRAVPTLLVVREGPAAGQSISLESLPVVVGGEVAPGIAGVNDPFVSTRHLEVERGGDGVRVRDLDSSNGTRLNGRELRAGASEMIEVGDELRLGPNTIIRVEAARPGEPEAARKTLRAPVPTLLVVREGPAAGQSISLESLPVVVGGEDAGIRGIPDRFVSTRHLEFERGPDGVRVRDLGSSNGTRLNGHRLAAGAPETIQIGDELRLGPTTVLQVE